MQRLLLQALLVVRSPLASPFWRPSLQQETAAAAVVAAVLAQTMLQLQRHRQTVV